MCPWLAVLLDKALFKIKFWYPKVRKIKQPQGLLQPQNSHIFTELFILPKGDFLTPLV